LYMTKQEQLCRMRVEADLRPECLMSDYGMLRIIHVEVVQ